MLLLEEGNILDKIILELYLFDLWLQNAEHVHTQTHTNAHI